MNKQTTNLEILDISDLAAVTGAGSSGWYAPKRTPQPRKKRGERSK